MELKKIEKIKDGKYLKNYHLTYTNKAGKDKIYEIVSRSEIENKEDLGKKVSGVSVVAFKDGKMMLLREFRMAVNKYIYNLCAGMLEDNETIEECVKRELYEETGLEVERVIDILNPCYSAVGISDVKTYIAFVEAKGDFSDNSSDNEDINAAFYTKEEVANMLKTEEFSSRCQMAAYFFSKMSQNGLEEFIKNGYIDTI